MSRQNLVLSWQSGGGDTFLPGTNRASDRFVRASYYMDTVIKTDNTNVALATAMGVIRNASVPVGITTPGQPNIAATQWRTMADQKNMVYYFESAYAPYLLSVDLKSVDLAEGSPTRKLTLTEQSALLVDGAFVSSVLLRRSPVSEGQRFWPGHRVWPCRRVDSEM